jgi:hypothetical protein
MQPHSALPSAGARALAFGAILVAGACGALIGYAIIDLQYDSGALAGIGAIVGGIIAAAGVAVIAVLVLRAMGEWRAQQEADQQEADRPGLGADEL